MFDPEVVILPDEARVPVPIAEAVCSTLEEDVSMPENSFTIMEILEVAPAFTVMVFEPDWLAIAEKM